jgi:hypothetical protein
VIIIPALPCVSFGYRGFWPERVTCESRGTVKITLTSVMLHPRPPEVAGGLQRYMGTLSFMVAAIYGLIGVLLGSVTTAVLTMYQEWRVGSREREARQHQRDRDREDQRNTFQRQSLLALQDAVSDLVKALFNEQDRMLEEMQRTDKWPARQWETPTATGWEDAELRLQVSRARVFNEELRELSRAIYVTANDAVWASSLDEAKGLTGPLVREVERFNDLIANALPKLY